MAKPDDSAAAALDVRDDEFEQVRRVTLRSFEVELVDGRKEQVFAHFHDSAQGVGHLSFVTVDPAGRQMISRCFNVESWIQMNEITTDQQQMAMARAAMAQMRRERLQNTHLDPDTQKKQGEQQKKVVPIDRSKRSVH